MKNYYNPFKVFDKSFLLLGLVFWLSLTSAFSQGVNYSQVQHIPMQINPAYAGNADFSSLILNYRSTQIDAESKFAYNQLSFMAPLYNKRTGFRTSGLGVSVFKNNYGAFDQYVFQGASFAYSRQVQLSTSSSLGMGAKVGAFQKSISSENFTTGSQWIRNRGYISDVDIGESFGDLRVSYFNAAFGLNYALADNNGQGYFNAGFAVYNMNRPDDSFLQINGRMPFMYVAHATYKLYSSEKLDVNSDILFSSMNKVHQVNGGAVLSYKFRNENPFDPVQTGNIDFICRYFYDNYFVLGLQLVQPNFVVGFSYDVGYKRFVQNSPIAGTTEFAITLRKPIVRKKKVPVVEKSNYSVGQTRKFETERPTELDQNKKIENEEQAKAETQPEGAGESQMIEEEDPFENWDGNLAGSPGKPIEMKRDFKFGFNEAELNEEAKGFLKDLYQLLSSNAQMKLLVTGHTDNVGKKSANAKVSYQRAKMVMDYLLELGLDKKRIKAIGKSDFEPLVPNNSDENRALNRRVEFTIFMN